MNTFQPALVIETIDEAMHEIVRALGGPKRVGPMLWPEKQPDAAARLVADCVNPERDRRFSPDQMLLLFRLAREANFHGAKQWFDDATGYSRSEPVSPEDERERLERATLAAVATLQGLTERLERLAIRAPLRSVAR